MPSTNSLKLVPALAQVARGRLQHLSASPLFSCLSDAELVELDSSVREYTFRRRELIWSPGDNHGSVYLVQSGICKISQPLGDDRVLTLGFHSRGDLIGEHVLYPDIESDISCTAFEDCTLLSVPVDTLQGLLSSNTSLSSSFSHLLARRRAAIQRRLKHIIFRSAHARLAGLFLDMVDDFGVRDARGTIINLKLTHREMAYLIGATRETVSFAILDLRKSKLLLTEGRRVILLDLAALKHLRDTGELKS